MKEDISHAFRDFVTCFYREKDNLSSSMMMRRQQSAESSLGIRRASFYARRSSSIRPTSSQELDIQIEDVDAEETSNQETVVSAKDLEPVLEAETVKYYNSAMEAGQMRHQPVDHDDNILEKAVSPKDAA
jgi:hypothetical protein